MSLTDYDESRSESRSEAVARSRSLHPSRGARPAPRPEFASLQQIADGLIEVRVAARTVGYVETVGPVFVALAGGRYDIAVEVAQSLSIQAAASALL